MSGRSEVHRLKARLDATITRAETVGDDEVRADLARYICVLVCGFLEKAVFELLSHYARQHSNTAVHRYLVWRLEAGFQNPSKDKIVTTLRKFEPAWGADLEAYIVDARQAAVGSILAQRHLIAHGGSSDISLARVKDYYAEVIDVVNRVADVLDGNVP